MTKIMDKEKVNLFDFLKSVSETKEELYELENFDKAYPPFMINRFLVASQDTIFLANIMSQLSHLPPKLQYAFYLKAIDKKKRYFQYAGKGKDKTKQLKHVMKYYQCSPELGAEYLKILTKEQLKLIKDVFSKKTSR